MGIYVPQMQQRFTGYDFGQNTARNLLDAVRIKNQKEMQIRQMQLQKDMQDKQIDATDKLTSKQLRTRYYIAREGNQLQRDLAADSNQLARDLQEGKLDWQTLNREDKQMFEKLAQQRGFINAESMLKTELDAQAERQNKDIAFRDKNLNFRKEIERGQLALSKNKLGFDKEMGRGSLALALSRLDQDQNQFLMNFDEKVRQSGIDQGNKEKEFGYKEDFLDEKAEQKRNEKSIKELSSIIAMNKAKEMEDSGRFNEELNRGINDTGFFQGAYDSLPFTRSTRQRVIEDNNINPAYQAPSIYRQVQDNNVGGNFLDIMNMTQGDFLNNPLFNTYQDDLNTYKLNP